MRQTFFELSVFAFIILEGYFIRRGFKKNPSINEASLTRQKNEAVDFMVMEPWRTKYHWGGIVQLILVALIFILK